MQPESDGEKRGGQMTDAPACNTHPDLVSFDHPLPHFRDSLNRQRRTRVVAIGSSSTAGVGDVVPYPYRLEQLFRQESTFYGRMIDIINRGIGGQESPEQLARFESDVIAEAPALVIWQVGTNAIYHKDSYNFDAVVAAIDVGLGWLAGLPMDVVLMDLQYTAALVTTSVKLALSEELETRIAEVAARREVNLFKRWALMKRWCTEGQIPLAVMDDGADEHLHMSDWATACSTKALCHAMVSAPEARSVVDRSQIAKISSAFVS
jgi:acyl-CoA thioesterase I